MKKAISVTVFLLLLFSSTYFSASAHATFVKYPNNPILIKGLSGEWDSVLVNSEVVTFNGNQYKMWYTGFNGSVGKIGLALSEDGKTWSKYSNNPVLSPTPGDLWELEVAEPTVILVGSTYNMWFTSVRATGPEEFYRIRHATSSDGINWIKTPGFVLQRSGLPWEERGVANPSIVKIGNEFKMWYSANDSSGPWRIGYATSIDGINWVKNPTPVLSPSLFWEGSAVAQPSVSIQNGIYHLYYHAGPIVPIYIGYATSVDGINWNKDPNPILERGGFGTFDANLIAQPDVVRVWNKLKMYYSGRNSSFVWSIGLAEEKVPVPYFAQDDPAWGGDIYDSADKWAHKNSQTMSSLGCAVTSAAMVLKNLNVQKTPGNPDASPNPLLAKDLNPGTLNEWLKSRNDGAFRNGATNWALIANMTKLAHVLDPTSPKLEYFASPSASLSEVLGNDLPAILNLPYPPSPSNTHFVVATEVDGATYKINDPFYEDRTTLAPHYDTVSRIGYYQPADSDFSYFILAVDPETTLTLKNELNQVVGDEVLELPIFDQVHQQSSGATALKVLSVKSPSSGDYTLEVSSQTNQPYQLDIYFYDVGGNGGLNSFTGTVGPAAPNFFEISLNNQNSANAVFTNVTFDLALFDTLITHIQEQYSKGGISQKGVYNSLLKKATNAKKAAEANDIVKATELLTALKNELNAQMGKFISETAYQLLQGDVETIVFSR